MAYLTTKALKTKELTGVVQSGYINSYSYRELLEWLKRNAWKAFISVKGYRGFESRTLCKRTGGSALHKTSGHIISRPTDFYLGGYNGVCNVKDYMKNTLPYLYSTFSVYPSHYINNSYLNHLKGSITFINLTVKNYTQ